MRFLTLSSLAALSLISYVSADVQYSVVAFPPAGGSVSVSVGGQMYPLKASDQSANLFQGTAPAGNNYQYVMVSGQTNTAETNQRTLDNGATSTGNEFFNRSRTIYDIPSLPQAINPLYPTLFTPFNTSNEIATIIATVNATAFDAILTEPTQKQKDAQVTELVYINSKDVLKFSNAGINNSGQSTKDFAKQSYAVDLNKFDKSSSTEKAPKDLLYGRTIFKLRAEETDQTLAREKLYLDCLAAAGAATLSGQWARLYVNNEPYGLYLMMDDVSTHLIDNVLHGGDWSSKVTGGSWKGNAVDATHEADFVYVGDDATLYSADEYKLEDGGEDKTLSTKNNTLTPLIGFMKQLSTLQPATDANSASGINNLINANHTMIHMAINWLAGSWDGFWYQASNFYINQQLDNNMWTLITYDFDETFGNGAPAGMVQSTYQNFTAAGAKRPLPNQYIQSSYFRPQFEDIVKTIIKRFFNQRVMEPRLKAWTDMLQEDIAWSRSIVPKSPGTKTAFTVQDFTTNMMTTDQGTTGLNDWVNTRSQATCQQLGITDTDDLPALPAYTQGYHIDANGNVVSNGANGNGNGVSPSGNSASSNLAAGMSMYLPSFALAAIFGFATLF